MFDTRSEVAPCALCSCGVVRFLVDVVEAALAPTMHDVGGIGGLGFEQLLREICGEPQYGPAQCGPTFR